MTISLIGAFGLSLVLAVVTCTVLRSPHNLVLVGLVCNSAGRRPKLRSLVATRLASSFTGRRSFGMRRLWC